MHLQPESSTAKQTAVGRRAAPAGGRWCCRPGPSSPTQRDAGARARLPIASDPDEPRPANLWRVHWFNDERRRGVVDVPGPCRAPEALTGVKAQIVVLLGDRFPMIGAHKVLAAYGCLVPRLVTGRFDPTSAQGRLAVDRQLLPRRRGDLAHPRLPRRRGAAGGHEPRALRLARALGERSGGHHPHARHREQRQGDLRQVRRARARSGQRHPQPVLRVRELPRPLPLHRARRFERVFDASASATNPDSRLAAFVVGDRLGRHHRRRRLPQGAARHEDRGGRGARMPDDARRTATASTTSRASATSTSRSSTT